MEPNRYATAAAFRRALEDRLQGIAGKETLTCSVCGVRLPLTDSWRDCFGWDSRSCYRGYCAPAVGP